MADPLEVTLLRTVLPLVIDALVPEGFQPVKVTPLTVALEAVPKFQAAKTEPPLLPVFTTLVSALIFCTACQVGTAAFAAAATKLKTKDAPNKLFRIPCFPSDAIAKTANVGISFVILEQR